MKHYNIQNYIRYKNDLEQILKRLEKKDWHNYSRNELVTKFMPLTENLARKFATSQQASGVMAITDMIQEGCLLYTSPSPRDRQKSRMPSSA